MIGAIIGDIVGSRFEFNNHRSTSFDLFSPESTFTDDTICTIAVADWILNSDKWGKTDQSRFAYKLQSWCRKYPMRGYGGLFQQWIREAFPRPYNSYGNGAAMRISPIGDLYGPSDNLDSKCKFITSVTHNHPEGIKGARAIAEAISMAWRSASKDQIREFVSGLQYDLDFTCDKIRKTNEFDETCQVTVPQAVVCFLESSDFESAIRLAVSIGGDSDTIACITGGIAEAFYKEIPPSIVQQARILLPEPMLEIIDEFYKRIPYETLRNT